MSEERIITEREKVYTYTVNPAGTPGGSYGTMPTTSNMGAQFLPSSSSGAMPSAGYSTGMGPGMVYTVPPVESISSASRIQPTELAAGPMVHPSEHMTSMLRRGETIEGMERLKEGEGISAGAAPPLEAAAALRMQPAYASTNIVGAQPAAPFMEERAIPMVPVESHRTQLCGPGFGRTVETARMVETVPGQMLRAPSYETVTREIPVTTTTTTIPVTTTMGSTSSVLPSVVGEPQTFGSGTFTPMASQSYAPMASQSYAPMASQTFAPTTVTTPAATTSAAPVHEKQGFFSHLFHHQPAATTAGAGTTAATTTYKDPLSEQAERFIDNIAKHPRELSYYEQFVVQYNRGMRFTPTQARRLLEVLLKNSAAKGMVPYYSVYAMELLLKLSIADPIFHNELARVEDQLLSNVRIGSYLANDETKLLGLNFVYYTSRFLGRSRYQDWVVSKKANQDTMWHQEIDSYILAHQNMDIILFLDSISRRLPPLLPHAPIGPHLIATTQKVPLMRETLTTVSQPETTTLCTMGTSTTYRPAV